MRMSSGSSRRKLKPRPSASSCIDDTPRSASAPADGVDAALVEHAVQLAVVGVHELDAIAERGQRFARQRERRRVAIEPEHAIRAGFEQRAAVAAETDRAVDEQPAARRLEQLEHLGHHDRLVQRRPCQMPNSDSAFASSSV